MRRDSMRSYIGGHEGKVQGGLGERNDTRGLAEPSWLALGYLPIRAQLPGRWFRPEGRRLTCVDVRGAATPPHICLGVKVGG